MEILFKPPSYALTKNRLMIWMQSARWIGCQGFKTDTSVDPLHTVRNCVFKINQNITSSFSYQTYKVFSI
jgi:hypothetical protein